MAGLLCETFEGADHREVQALERLEALDAGSPILIQEKGGAYYVHKDGVFGWGHDVEIKGPKDMQKDYEDEALYTVGQLESDLGTLDGVLKSIVVREEKYNGDSGTLYDKLSLTSTQDHLADLRHRVDVIKADMDEHGYDMTNDLTGKCTLQ